MEETMRQRRKRREFTDAYKAEVVTLCQKGDRSMAEVARDLDLTETSGFTPVRRTSKIGGVAPGGCSADGADDAAATAAPEGVHGGLQGGGGGALPEG